MIARALREIALALPEAYEDHPWGESAFKVRKKVFLFMHLDGDELSLSLKLPLSGEVALTLSFTSPTGYGLGKSGWVSARFAAEDGPPVAMLEAWIEESYRAVAPKKLAAQLIQDGETASVKPAAAKQPAAKKAATKKAAKKPATKKAAAKTAAKTK